MRGAKANELGLPFVEDDIKASRYARLMARQQAISARILKGKVGKHLSVIIDAGGPSVAKGRSTADAPEIDGAVYVASKRPLRPGDMVSVKIERVDAYDLHGVAV